MVKAKGKKITNAPGWLGLTDDKISFVHLPDRAEVVRRIFDLSIGGMGGYSIAKLLNSENLPAFGPSGRWDQSTIHNMLTSRATIGEHQRKQTIGGKEYPLGEPIPGYYPSVIDEKTFEAAQEARRKNLRVGRGRKGRVITNLFSGLTHCFYCGSEVKFHSNGQRKSLICKKVLENGDCLRLGWSYRNFENSFFQFLLETRSDSKLLEQLEQLRSGQEQELYGARVAMLQSMKKVVSRITIAAGGVNPPDTDPDAHIRRDYPERHFQVTFNDRSLAMGYPFVASAGAPLRTFSSAELSDSLGLSPRQGELTALLAEGQSLTLAAAKLAMTLATARWHLREIFKRTGCHSQNELASLAENFSKTSG